MRATVPKSTGRGKAAGPRRSTYIDDHIGALQLVKECGLTDNVRRWLSDEVIAKTRLEGSAAQKSAIRDAEDWLIGAERHEATHGTGSLIERSHDFVKLLQLEIGVPHFEGAGRAHGLGVGASGSASGSGSGFSSAES